MEAHRSGLSVHRIAQIFRERSVDISVPHMLRTIRRLIDEVERVADRSPAPGRPVSPMTKERRPESAAAKEAKPKAPVTYQLSEQPSSRVQEEEFAKQLRLARYLAAGSSPSSRSLEAAPEARTPKKERPVAKTKPKAAGKKAREEELAKERRRAGRAGHKVQASGSGRGARGESRDHRLVVRSPFGDSLMALRFFLSHLTFIRN